MSKLILIRHAQASFMKADYDQLSEKGERQSQLLGQYLAEHKAAFDRVIIGPLKRHRQTAGFVQTALEAKGLPWKATMMPEFDEHRGPTVVKHIAVERGLMENQSELAMRTNPPMDQKAYFKLFKEITFEWASGKIDSSKWGLLNWQPFKDQVHTGIQKIMDSSQKGETVAVFTSGGTISVAIGHALGLTDKKMLELSLLIQNSSMTEFLFSKHRFSIKSMNVISHLTDEEMITLV